MGNFKSFILGVGVAFGIYYIAKKRSNGTSLLGEILDNPSVFVNKAKNYALNEAAQTIKEKLL